MGVSSMEALTFPPFSLSWPDYRDEVERVYLSALLSSTVRGNVMRAAYLAGVSRTALYAKMRRLGL